MTHGNRIPESYLARFLPSARQKPAERPEALPEGLAAFLAQLGPTAPLRANHEEI